MNEHDIYDQLTLIFREVFDDEGLDISKNTNASEIDEWDSMMHISLVVSIERHFQIRLSSAQIAELNDVGEMVEVIKAKIR